MAKSDELVDEAIKLVTEKNFHGKEALIQASKELNYKVSEKRMTSLVAKIGGKLRWQKTSSGKDKKSKQAKPTTPNHADAIDDGNGKKDVKTSTAPQPTTTGDDLQREFVRQMMERYGVQEGPDISTLPLLKPTGGLVKDFRPKTWIWMYYDALKAQGFEGNLESFLSVAVDSYFRDRHKALALIDVRVYQTLTPDQAKAILLIEPIIEIEKGHMEVPLLSVRDTTASKKQE